MVRAFRSRWSWLALAAAVLIGVTVASFVSCSASTPTPSPPPKGSLLALQTGGTKLGIFPGVGEVLTGDQGLFTFILVTDKGQLLAGGTPQVYAATSETAMAAGPFTATWHTFTGYRKYGDKSPIAGPGFFAATVSIPTPGLYRFLAVGSSNGAKVSALTDKRSSVEALEHRPVADPGTKAISVKTPVATTLAERTKVDTRDPPTDMHYISLDQALTNGKPTVVSFATPLLCQSRVCGPVVDEQLDVFKQVGKAKANFIFVEEFPQRDQTKPSPAFVKWGFTTEPWVVVIDKTGIIRTSFEGPVDSGMIKAALDPLL